MFDSRYHSAMARLRYKQLQLVSTLGRTLNLNRAASQMVMTQPAATKMLQEVEDIVGAPLFERLPRGMQPTRIGEVAIAFAHRAIDDSIRFLDEARIISEGGDGVLRVGTLPSAAHSILPQVMSVFRERRPKLVVRLQIGTSDQLVVALLKNDLDLVIGRRSGTTSPATNFVPLAEEEAALFCAARHPLTRQGRVKIADLYDQPWVLQPPTSPLRMLMERFFRENGISPSGYVETTSVHVTLQFVRATHMLSILPLDLINEDSALGRVAQLPVEVPSNMGPYGIITRAGEQGGEIATEFAEVAKRCVAPENPPPQQAMGGTAGP